jgi:hypothetical protein
MSALAGISWQGSDFQSLDSAEQKLVREFTTDTLLKLPTAILESANQKVTFEFAVFDNDKKMTLPSCLDFSVLEKKMREQIENPSGVKDPGLAKSQRGSIYGKTQKSFWSSQYRVRLNRQFLPIILGGSRRAEQYACGHGNAYRLAQATLLHELSHVYDDENYPANHDPQEMHLRSQCQEWLGPSPRRDEAPSECRPVIGVRHSVSDRIEWKNLFNWNAGILDNQPRNQLSFRSPDAYEYANLKEAFAVNMEHFLLDPEYACRRPEVFNFLSEHFQFKPEGLTACRVNTKLRLSSKPSVVDLDWTRLYEVHYLMAAKGTQAESSFGHSMFRLVFCSPQRKEVNEECLKDQQYHVVISFRASIDGLQTNRIKGLTGQYPSQMFIYSLSQIISEYTVAQFRDLVSIPMKLTESEKQRFVQRILQYYWEYQGRYYFITNNCATEAVNFVKGTVFRPEIQQTVSFIDTPMSLYRLLRKNNLLNEEPFDLTNLKNKRNTIEGRYVFSSYGKVIAQTLSNLGPALQNPKDIYELADRIGTPERKRLFDSMAAKLTTKSQIKELAISFYRLERAISYVFEEDKRSLIGEIIAKDSSQGGASSGSAQNISEILGLRFQLTPWFLASQGYGIPMESEIKSEAYIRSIYGKIEDLVNSLQENLHEDFSQIDQEIADVNMNLQYFFDQISKNVELPRGN